MYSVMLELCIIAFYFSVCFVTLEQCVYSAVLELSIIALAVPLCFVRLKLCVCAVYH